MRVGMVVRIVLGRCILPVVLSWGGAYYLGDVLERCKEACGMVLGLVWLWSGHDRGTK
ncbi:hypothetical protein HHX47_DHR1000832, partial [Lentinula edodes]